MILAKRKNILCYVKFSGMFLQNVECLRYSMLRYVRVENQHNHVCLRLSMVVY